MALVGCAALLTLTSGFIMVVVGLVQLFADRTSPTGGYPIYSFGLISLTIGVILVPFTMLKIRSLGFPIKPDYRQISAFRFHNKAVVPFLVNIWVAVLLVGYMLIGKGILSTLIMPLLSILGVILPVSIYVIIVSERIDSIEPSRAWGVVSTGMTLGPIIGLILEMAFLIATLVGVIIFAKQDTSLLSNLQLLTTRLVASQDNPEILNNIIESFIHRPVNLFLIFMILSGLLPILEEFVKQIPFWMLSWHKLTPGKGFIIGALSGAGFALAESLITLVSVEGSNQWLYLIVGRAGAGLMHVIAGGIGGWGLAAAIRGRSYTKAILAYLVSVAIHGTWNALALLEGIRMIRTPELPPLPYINPTMISITLMVILFLVMLIVLIYNNRILKD